MDGACDADRIGENIRERGAIAVIPSKANRRIPREFDAELHGKRNLIERLFGRPKASFGRIATRHEKTARNFMAMIKLASVRLWCQFYANTA